MNYSELIILADDVTGAADSAARCVHAGLTATIELFPGAYGEPIVVERLPSPVSMLNVLALSTDSRFLPPVSAAQRVATIAQQVIHRYDRTADGVRVRWYKKIDSTLRGNIGAELAALLPLVTPMGCIPHAVIAPAFPAQERTLVDGYLCYAQLPPRTRHLPTMLAEQCALTITTIGLAIVRSGIDAISRELARTAAAPTLIVVDAERDEDLAALCAAVEATMPHALLCGSAGLVGALASRRRSPLNAKVDQSTDNTIPESISHRHPIVAVVGSGSAMAHQQLDYLREQSTASLIEIEELSAIEPILEEQRRRHPIGGPSRAIVLHLPKPHEGMALEGEVARQLAANLAVAAQKLIAAIQPDTVLVVGGDTAVHLLQQMAIRQLQVIRELLPGMPLALGKTPMGKQYQIILKAGNHGDRQTLAQLLNQSA